MGLPIFLSLLFSQSFVKYSLELPCHPPSILDYHSDQHERLHQACQSHPRLCVGIDETWFDQTVLVMMELSSGYLLVEKMVEDHRYTTWQTSIETMLKSWSGHIHYCVNDRAKALRERIRLA